MKHLIDSVVGSLSSLGNPLASNTVQDIEKNIKAMVQAALGKMDVVPKEEFEVQQRLLARLQEQVAQLEKKCAALEQES